MWWGKIFLRFRGCERCKRMVEEVEEQHFRNGWRQSFEGGKRKKVTVLQR